MNFFQKKSIETRNSRDVLCNCRWKEKAYIEFVPFEGVPTTATSFGPLWIWIITQRSLSPWRWSRRRHWEREMKEKRRWRSFFTFRSIVVTLDSILPPPHNDNTTQFGTALSFFVLVLLSINNSICGIIEKQKSKGNKKLRSIHKINLVKISLFNFKGNTLYINLDLMKINK